MKFSQLFCPTLKETPKDAEVISHQLMLRAGLIRKVASGIYAYLPLGLRSLRKFEQIVREEMENAGAQELTMPSIIPSSLWKKTGRWDKYGKELLRINDRHENEFCYGPTHEEVITELASYGIRSYKQLPINLFQIQTKFRDEIRPRFGLMRGREFTMKDAYSFHHTQECLDQTYKDMEKAYEAIFKRCGLSFRQVHADSGSIGGSESAEFMVMAHTGEDEILISNKTDYATNIEAAPTMPFHSSSSENSTDVAKIDYVPTPGKKTIEDVAKFLNKCPQDCIKALLYKAGNEFVLVLLQGNHELNELKLQAILQCDELIKANDVEILEVSGADQGYLGPVSLQKNCRIFVDHSLSLDAGYVAGANQTDTHILNLVISRDVTDFSRHDLRLAQKGDICPIDQGQYETMRGIEVGHIFKLGELYSKALDGHVLNETGKTVPMKMGCYGIGVGRTVAASIEQNHDDKGIVWPLSLAPFEVDMIVIGKDESLKQDAETLYHHCRKADIDIILDERAISPGVKFKDAELIGFPVQCIIGKHFQSEGKVEIVVRKNLEKHLVPKETLITSLKEILNDYGS